MSKKREMTKKDDLESRFRKMEVHLAYLTGAATVLVISVLVFLGATSWYTIPTAVEKQINSAIGEKMKKKLDEAKKKADRILSASVLQDNVKSFDERFIELQKELSKINDARLCKNPVEMCVCNVDEGMVDARLVVCITRCPDGRLRGIEIKELVTTGTKKSLTCNNLKSNVSW